MGTGDFAGCISSITNLTQGVQFQNHVSVSHLHISVKQEGGHWAFFFALNCDAMALPHRDYNRVQISVDICAAAAPTDCPWTVEHLLHHFHLDAYQCEVNDLIFPMMSEPARHLMPAIETMEQHWVSWDEPLVSDRRVHWAICERELFRYMADVSQVVDNICTLGEADLQPTHLHAHLELHFLSPVALLEALNKVHRTVRRHAVQIQQLTAQLNQIQVQLDRSREYAGDGE